MKGKGIMKKLLIVMVAMALFAGVSQAKVTEFDKIPESVTLFKLLRAFERVMQRMEDARRRPMVHQIVQFNYSIEDQQQHILTMVHAGGTRPNFIDVFGHCKNRIHAIVTFLGLLELLNLQQIRLVGGAEVNSFWLEPYPDEEE